MTVEMFKLCAINQAGPMYLGTFLFSGFLV